jgi:hypothetical protein
MPPQLRPDQAVVNIPRLRFSKSTALLPDSEVPNRKPNNQDMIKEVPVSNNLLPPLSSSLLA